MKYFYFLCHSRDNLLMFLKEHGESQSPSVDFLINKSDSIGNIMGISFQGSNLKPLGCSTAAVALVFGFRGSKTRVFFLA